MAISENDKKKRQEKVKQSDEAINQLNDLTSLNERIKKDKLENDRLREEEARNIDPLKKIASTETTP